jgi:hypothetical protein
VPDLQSLGGSLALACGIIAIVRRKRAFGGWLFYFFCQLLIGLALVAVSTNWTNYLPKEWSDPARYFLFVVSSLSRTAMLAAIGVICIVLVETRDAQWIAGLQYSLATYALLTIIKIPVDIYCFVGATARDTMSLGFPIVWMAYFSVSQRVRKVFREKSWER